MSCYTHTFGAESGRTFKLGSVTPWWNSKERRVGDAMTKARTRKFWIDFCMSGNM